MKIVKLISIGFRMNGDELSSVFVLRGSDASDGKNYKFYKKGKHPIGTIYEATIEGSKTILNPNKILPETIEDKTLLKTWIAQSKAAQAHARAINSKKRVQSILLSEDTKKELQKIVDGLSHQETRYFLDELVYEFKLKADQEELQRRINAAISKRNKSKKK